MLLDYVLARAVRRGRMNLIDRRGASREYGDGGGPALTVRLHRRGTALRIGLTGSLGLAEAWMDGELTVEGEGGLYELLSLLAENLEAEGYPFWMRAQQRLQRVTRAVRQRNPVGRARRNVAHHYDLTDAFYDLFLDPDKQYSCAYFAGPDVGLDAAQRAKMRHIAAKLVIEPGMSAIDVGSGWGGLGVHLAREWGATVHGVTLSERQHRLSNERARSAGVSDRARFSLMDYRKVEDRYDRLVSVGMFEHVGVGHYREYFAKLRALLKPDGVALLHTIGRSDGPGATDPFIRKYIFPGGYIPALSEILPAVEASGLVVCDIEVLRLHYARTLRAWRERFLANRHRAAALYDERFCRMWEFYLAGSEVSFRHMGMVVFQIQLARRQDAAPLTRDYIARAERGAGTD